MTLFVRYAMTCAAGVAFASVVLGAAPSDPVAGTLAATGSPMTASLMERWTDAFKKILPDASIAFTVSPSATPADRVALGSGLEEIFHNDHTRYIEKNFREPFRIEVSLGSFDTKGKMQATGVFVHRDNPLARLTLAQLDAIYSTTRRRGHPVDIATWGDLGLTGEWAAQPIHLYGRRLDQEVPWHFRDVVLLDGFFKRAYRSPGKGGSVDVVDAVAADRFGITFVAFMHATPGVKALALADRDGEFVEPSAAGFASGRYPLARPLWLYVNRAPDAALDPRTKAFLEFTLSTEGQSMVAADGYLPLPAALVAAERMKLQ